MTNEETAVRDLGNSIGYGRLMQLAEQIWKAVAIAGGVPGSEHTTGPCAVFMVPCQCRELKKPQLDSNGHCDWCCGAGRVTERVRQAQRGTLP